MGQAGAHPLREAIAVGGLARFLEIGTALAELRNRRLYRVQYASFEDYVSNQFGLRRSAVDGVIRSAQTAQVLLDAGLELPPDTMAVGSLKVRSVGLRTAGVLFAGHPDRLLWRSSAWHCANSLAKWRKILHGRARSASGHSAEGIACIEHGIRDGRASGSRLLLPFWLALKAEALHLAGRTYEALEALKDAETLMARSEEPWWCALLHRLKGVFLTAMGADEREIEASFCEAIRIAKDQKSVSLEKRAEATYAEYRRQKASASGGRGSDYLFGKFSPYR